MLIHRVVMVTGEAVRKFWFLLTDTSVIVAVDAWFTIIAGAVSSGSSLGRLVGHWLVVFSLCFFVKLNEKSDWLRLASLVNIIYCWA